MILKLASFIGMFILYTIGFLLCVGLVIAIIALINYLMFCRKMRNGEELDSSQDLKKTTKILEKNNKQKKEEVKKSDSAFSKTIWVKLYNIVVFSLWVVVYSCWFAIMCIISLFGLIYEFVADCFNKNKIIH